MKEDEAVDAALEELPRNDDGGIDEKALIDAVAELIDFNEQQERINKATRAVKRRRKPGSSPPEGQICLPGMEPYGYEPERLVADNEGHVVEQRTCRPNYKRAEAERSRNVARRHQIWASRKTEESEAYAAWTIEQLASGRRHGEITFDAFLHETGYWKDGEAPVEIDPDNEGTP